MPLILLTGYPCSGLTHRANQLSTLLEQAQDSFGPPTSSKARYKIHIVSSHDSSHPRTVYGNARSEKEARAVVYGRVKRALGRDSIVIVDGMNYIKGWRYQLWCDSKSMGTPSCVVHVGTPIDQCTANNDARLKRKEKEEEEEQGKDTTDAEGDTEEPYPPELLQNLIYRYEEPTTMSRWDKPLFTVPWSDPTPPIEEIWSAITGTTIPKLSTTGETPPPDTSATTTGTPENITASTTTSTPSLRTLPRPKIKPHQATVLPAATDPTALHALDKRTSSIISTLRSWTLSHSDSATEDPDGVGITIPIPDVETPVFIPPSASAGMSTEELAGAGGLLALPRLHRLRRQWMGLNRAHVARGDSGLAADQAGEAFVRFLNAEFEGMEAEEDE